MWWFKVLVAATIVVVLLSFLLPSREDSDQKQINSAARQIAMTIGTVAAEETVKLLGGSNGKVAVLIPLYGAEAEFSKSDGPLLLRSFEKRVKGKATFLGHYKVQRQPEPVNWPVALQTVREKFPDAHVLVSFVGLPLLDQGHLSQWHMSSPPKIIAVEVRDQLVMSDRLRPLQVEQAQRFFLMGCGDVLLLREGDMTLGISEKKSPRELFDRWFKIYAR